MSFVILLSLLVNVYAQSGKLYIEEPEYRNKKVHSKELTEFTTDSLTFCALHCTDFCTCFGFNNRTTTCRVQRECDPAVATDDSGWKYYGVKMKSKGFFINFLPYFLMFLYLIILKKCIYFYMPSFLLLFHNSLFSWKGYQESHELFHIIHVFTKSSTTMEIPP